jgi:hypothetical protein
MSRRGFDDLSLPSARGRNALVVFAGLLAEAVWGDGDRVRKRAVEFLGRISFSIANRATGRMGRPAFLLLYKN